MSSEGRRIDLVSLSWKIASIAIGFLVFRRLGLSPLVAIGLPLAIFLGSRLDVPLPRPRRIGSRQESSPTLTMNVGGAIIPLAIALFLTLRLPASDRSTMAIDGVLVAIITHRLARAVPGRGIVLPWIFPGLLAAALAIVMSPLRPSDVAFSAATFGTFLGADLLSIPSLGRAGAVRASLGGSGSRDGILWSGLLSVAIVGNV